MDRSFFQLGQWRDLNAGGLILIAVLLLSGCGASGKGRLSPEELAIKGINTSSLGFNVSSVATNADGMLAGGLRRIENQNQLLISLLNDQGEQLWTRRLLPEAGARASWHSFGLAAALDGFWLCWRETKEGPNSVFVGRIGADGQVQICRRFIEEDSQYLGFKQCEDPDKLLVWETRVNELTFDESLVFGELSAQGQVTNARAMRNQAGGLNRVDKCHLLRNGDIALLNSHGHGLSFILLGQDSASGRKWNLDPDQRIPDIGYSCYLQTSCVDPRTCGVITAFSVDYDVFNPVAHGTSADSGYYKITASFDSRGKLLHNWFFQGETAPNIQSLLATGNSVLAAGSLSDPEPGGTAWMARLDRGGRPATELRLDLGDFSGPLLLQGLSAAASVSLLDYWDLQFQDRVLDLQSSSWTSFNSQWTEYSGDSQPFGDFAVSPASLESESAEVQLELLELDTTEVNTRQLLVITGSDF